MEIGRKYGHAMNILDLGGGYPAGELPESLVDILRQTQNDPLGYRVIAEPGRHMCSNNFYLACRVIGRRIKHRRTCLHVNDGLYHGFNNFLMDCASFDRFETQFYSVLY